MAVSPSFQLMPTCLGNNTSLSVLQSSLLVHCCAFSLPAPSLSSFFHYFPFPSLGACRQRICTSFLSFLEEEKWAKGLEAYRATLLNHLSPVLLQDTFKSRWSVAKARETLSVAALLQSERRPGAFRGPLWGPTMLTLKDQFDVIIISCAAH